MIGGADAHKYLGRKLSGDLRNRGQCNLDHRVACAWMKFHNRSSTFLNRRVPLKLRLKLFDSVVSPAALYSLSATPLTAKQCEKLVCTQRKMMRRIVGWIRLDDESWETTGSRMKARLQAALAEQPIKPWSEARLHRRHLLLKKLGSSECNPLLQAVFKWSLEPAGTSRRRGRPRQRWHQ